MARLTTAQYRFRKHEQVGVADAEHDSQFLGDCFVDAGDLRLLSDCGDPRRILLGRTGSGKTALILKLSSTADHVVRIKPEQLSLAYLTNNTMLPYLMSIGVDLDLFYRLLWRHVFAVELIKERYGIRTEDEKKSFLTKIFGQFLGDRRKERAMQYLVEYGQSFWKETEYRVKEITRKLEENVRASLGTKSALLDAGMSHERVLSSHETAELCERAQSVVNSIQVRDLFEVVDLLATDLLNDPQFRVYIVIDGLDEGWIDDRFRFRLIRALIETMREFLKIRSSKIIIALRVDLIERVVRETRGTGFQEEKYTDLYLPLTWNQAQLLEVLDKRIDKVVRQRYTSRPVTHKDILPDAIDGIGIDDFLTSRTLMRPRDIIQFFNKCIECAVEQANGNPSMTVAVVKAADERHSRDRLRSLGDEWQSVFPDLLDAVEILKKRPASFRVSDITENEILEILLRLSTSLGDGPIKQRARSVMDDLATSDDVMQFVWRVFHRVGLVGLKMETFQKTAWSVDGRSAGALPVTDRSIIEIHPVFHRVLGVRSQ